MIFLVVGAGLAVLTQFWKRHADLPQFAAPTAEVSLADISQVVLASAVVQPRLKVDVSAQVSGQVRKLHVQPGDMVKEGDLLVSLDPEMAKNEVAQAKANLAQQEASMASRKVDLAQAQRELGRQRTLLKGNATSRSELEKAEADLAKIERDIQGMEATLSKQAADLANARLKRNFTKVTAPISGEVASLAVQKGQSVNAIYQSPLLLTLVKLDVMTIRAQVPEADIRWVRVGQRASFVTLGDSQRKHEGTVRLVQPLPEKINNSVYYNVLFDVPNTGPTRADWPLMSDMTGQVRIAVAQAAGVPTLPLAALGDRAPDGSYTVQVAGAPGQPPQTRRIRTGLSDSSRVQVLEGLQPGERVLLPVAPPSSAAPFARPVAQ